MNDTTERFLQDQGVAYDVETIPLDKIDPGSFKRQVRGEEVITHIRDEYCLAMIGGDVFPKIIVRRTALGTFYVIDGIHRVAASGEAEFTTIDACVVDVVPDRGRQLSLIANRYHGQRTTREEALYHAIELHRNHGYAVNRAAAIMQIPPSTVAKAVQRHEGSKRATALGANGYDSLPITAQDALNAIRLDEAFRQAIVTARTRRLSGKDIMDMSTRIRATGTEHDAVEVARTFVPQDAADAKRSARADSARGRLRTITTSALQVDEASFRADLVGMSVGERQELADRFRKAARRLEVFADVASS